MKTFLSAALAGAAFLAVPANAAVLVQYDFNDNTGTEGTEAAVNVAAGLTGIAFQRGAGLTATSGSDSINSSGFNGPGDTDFYSFGLNVVSGFTASVNQLVFGSRASASGPGAINVMAQVDGRAFTTIASFTNAAATDQSRTLDFAALTATSSILFRFMPANNNAANGTSTTAAGGTFRIQNPVPGAAALFSINGNVNAVQAAVPETATWAMLLVGFGATGVAIRRRRATARVTFA